ncbi:TPA: hypothetical protein DEP96_01205 [Candidatus Uhrbacteria bacterium]|nr:hypothetical protein [Candidatus Uhrbacteria bacterium]
MRKFLLASLLAVSLLVPNLTLAVGEAAKSYGLDATGAAAGLNTGTTENNDITQFIGKYAIKPILGLVGLAFFILMIYGGVLWMIAGGNETMVKKAQSILMNAFIGAVVIVAAYALTNAVLNAITVGSVSGTP